MTIGVGLAGYGLAGAMLHAPIIEGLPEYHIAAVMTSRPQAAARRDRPVVVADIEALVLCDTVDLVVVATPNPLHAMQAETALRAGKHVLVDKPMATTARDCDRLIDLAQATGRVLSIYHNRRWDGDFLAAKEEARQRPPSLYEAHWDRFRPSATDGWRNAAEDGSGLVWDLGAHLVDQAVQLFGWPEAITGDLAIQRPKARSDDYFELILHYGERRAVLSASSLIAATRPRFALHGLEGSWWTEALDPAEAALRHNLEPVNLGPIAAFRATRDGERLSEPVSPGDPYAFYRLLAQAILNGSPPPVEPVDARNVVALIEAVHAGRGLPVARSRA